MDIYKITDKTNGLVYIGRTSRDVHKRIAEHKYKKSLIGQAIRKKGIDNFFVEIIDHTDDYTKGRELESKWINYYDSFFPKGYNLADGDKRYGHINGFWGKHHNSTTVMNNILHQAGRKRVKDLNTGFLYPSIRYCARALGITKTQVSRLCTGLCPNSEFHLVFVKE